MRIIFAFLLFCFLVGGIKTAPAEPIEYIVKLTSNLEITNLSFEGHPAKTETSKEDSATPGPIVVAATDAPESKTIEPLTSPPTTAATTKSEENEDE